MKAPLAGLTLAVVLTACALAGCTPAPEPEPAAPAPLFTSEADAFAAAEETYRAYVDALNQVDLSDPETFEDVYAWTTGDLNGRDRETFSNWHADDYSLAGSARVSAFHPVFVEGDEASTVVVNVCYDITDVDVRDRDGVSLVAADRPNVQPLQLTLVGSSVTATGLSIASIDPADGAIAC